jgi:hypothetical protein
MTGWRRVVRRILPAALAAMCLLVPGAWANTAHKKKPARHYVAKHYVAKRSVPRHYVRPVPPRRASVRRAPKRMRRLPNRRAPARKAKRTRRVYHPTAYHRRYRRYYRPRYRFRYGPSADRIEQIQRALSRSGFYQGDPTGRWDANTIGAMKSFQQAHGITPTGKIDALSLQQLGLGSDIAGLAPPRPVISPEPASSDKSGGNGKGAGGR